MTKIHRLQPHEAELACRVVDRFHGRTVSAQYMTKLLANDANFLLVAQGEAEVEVAGFLFAHRIDSLEREASAMFIYEIEVAEHMQRRGVGAALIVHIRALADAEGMFESFVFTNHSNVGAVAFYRATGGQIEEGDELMFVYPRPQ